MADGPTVFPDWNSLPAQDDIALPVDSQDLWAGTGTTAGDYTLGPIQGPTLPGGGFSTQGSASSNTGSTWWKNALNLAGLGTVIAGYATQHQSQNQGATRVNPAPPATFTNTFGKTFLYLGVGVLIVVAMFFAMKHAPRSVSP